MRKTERSVKGKLSKRILGAVLTAALVLGTVLLPQFTVEVKADSVKTITGLGTGAIGNPNKPESGSSKWSGSYVYYGKYGGNPVKYRVLSKKTAAFGGNTMFLDCDSILLQKIFDDNSKQWGESELHEWLNGKEFLGSTSIFSTAEKEAIAESTAGEHEFAEYVKEPVRGWLGISIEGKKYYTALNKDKILLLDVEDVLNEDYGYSADNGWTKDGDN